jgi:Ca-activated chloride channel family protein
VPTHTGEAWAEVDVWLDERVRASAGQAVAVALVLDHSGSMSGRKLEEAQRAAHTLVNKLNEADLFTLVSFSNDALSTHALPMNASGRAAMHAAIDALSADGGTNIAAGLEAGARALSDLGGATVRRLVLVTDGNPTAGETTERGLADLVSRVHTQGITVTALGVGADYNGMMMQHLAERGGGMYGYLANAVVLDEVLSKELDAARTSVTREVLLTLEAGAGATFTEVAGRLPLQLGPVTQLQLSALHPGEHTRVFARLRTPAIGASTTLPLTARATWRGLDGTTRQGTAMATLTTTENESEVVNSRNAEVFERGVSAFAAEQLVAAAAAYERGDRGRAESLLGSARSWFGRSANALAGEAEVDQVRQLGVQPGEAQRHGARALERKKLLSFGKDNGGY